MSKFLEFKEKIKLYVFKDENAFKHQLATKNHWD
jgi:hypothetical protein